MAIIPDDNGISGKSRNTAARVTQVAAISVMVIGLLALLGWLFNITFFKSVFANTVSMKPNTALACLFAGASCLMASLNRTNAVAAPLAKCRGDGSNRPGRLDNGRMAVRSRSWH